MKNYFVLVITAIFMAFVSGYMALFMQASYRATAEDIIEITKLKTEFQRRIPPQSIINFNTLYFSKGQFELLNPLNYLPRPQVDQDIRYSTNKNCFKNFKQLLNENNFEKLWIWEEFRCRRRPHLPPGFFYDPPFLHPSGKSYAYLAFMTGFYPYGDKLWILDNLPYFHVLELSELKNEVGELRGAFKVLEKLNEEALSMLSQGQGTILTQDFLLARLRYPQYLSMLEYRIYDRRDLDQFVKDSPFMVYNYNSNRTCFYKDGAICWDYNVKHVFKVVNKSTLGLFVGLLIIVVLVVHLLMSKLKQQRQEDEKRRLALQLLTHEFRTPITSLVLVTERMGRRFENFDEATQEDYLRLSSEVSRMRRLVEMSRSYLKANKARKLIQFQFEELPSVNEFFEELLVGYEDKYNQQNEAQIRLHPLSEDMRFNTDIYWTRICVENLVENALAHGSLPIDIILSKRDDKLVVTVQDSGTGSDLSLEQMTSEFVKGKQSGGTGLGLNIVYKVMRELGGQLQYQSNPTRFELLFSDTKPGLKKYKFRSEEGV